MSQQINYLRQMGVLSPKMMHRVFIDVIGIGGIGSPLALTLAKMGIPRMRFWDDDHVENHNLPHQMYKPKDIGRLKVEALRDNILEYVPDIHIETMPEHFGKDSVSLRGIVVSAVDSMASRKTIWEGVRENPRVHYYIEARMGFQVFQIFSLKSPFTAEQIAWYESNLFSDERAVKAPCTARAIIYTVMDSAGWMANQIKRFITGEEFYRDILVDLTNQNVLVQ